MSDFRMEAGGEEVKGSFEFEQKGIEEINPCKAMYRNLMRYPKRVFCDGVELEGVFAFNVARGWADIFAGWEDIKEDDSFSLLDGVKKRRVYGDITVEWGKKWEEVNEAGVNN